MLAFSPTPSTLVTSLEKSLEAAFMSSKKTHEILFPKSQTNSHDTKIYGDFILNTFIDVVKFIVCARKGNIDGQIVRDENRQRAKAKKKKIKGCFPVHWKTGHWVYNNGTFKYPRKHKIHLTLSKKGMRSLSRESFLPFPHRNKPERRCTFRKCYKGWKNVFHEVLVAKKAPKEDSPPGSAALWKAMYTIFASLSLGPILKFNPVVKFLLNDAVDERNCTSTREIILEINLIIIYSFKLSLQLENFSLQNDKDFLQKKN